jgi:hypothetical protein
MLDNIWIFVVIIGAVISIAQKNQQKQRNAESGEEPSLDPQAELERRMHEIFGEGKSVEQTPENKPMPAPVQPSNTINRPAYTQPKVAKAKGANQSANSTIHNTSSKFANSAKKQDPIKRGDITSKQSDIEEIIDDFTMEKALIYSEVIRPKFEEI